MRFILDLHFFILERVLPTAKLVLLSSVWLLQLIINILLR